MAYLEIKDLSVTFRVEGRDVEAVKHASFSLDKGETLAIVGESGSVKSVTALSVLQLLPYPQARHPSGSILVDGEELVGAPPVVMLMGRLLCWSGFPKTSFRGSPTRSP